MRSFFNNIIYITIISVLLLASCKEENNSKNDGDGMQVTGDAVITNAETEAVGHTVDSVDIVQHLDSINNLPQ